MPDAPADVPAPTINSVAFDGFRAQGCDIGFLAGCAKSVSDVRTA
ncbi:MAG TPA: hypothetical protein VGJ20_17810 [Xanthobacteraceae bacterium]|jgi:hypothetical protein